MPIELVWIGGVLVAGAGVLIFALFSDEDSHESPAVKNQRASR